MLIEMGVPAWLVNTMAILGFLGSMSLAPAILIAAWLERKQMLRKDAFKQIKMRAGKY